MPVERRPVGSEGADAGGDDHGARLDHRALRCGELPATGLPFERLDLFAKVIDRIERRGLHPEPADQVGSVDPGEARDVVDRLLGIERGALAADVVEHVDHVAGEPHHAAFEDGEQADRPRAHDDHVGLMMMSVGHVS